MILYLESNLLFQSKIIFYLRTALILFLRKILVQFIRFVLSFGKPIVHGSKLIVMLFNPFASFAQQIR